jgi:hypothetical protein
MGPCLAFPFLDADGKPVTWLPQGEEGAATPQPFVRLKPDKPRQRDGKPVKYESPLKSGNRIYIPPGVGAILADAAKELVIVEGEKKALAGTQDGFPTIGLCGVWNWTVKRTKDPVTGRGTGPRKLIEGLERINWRGRKVTIIFDSDLKEKPEVEWARWHLAKVLTERGADVRVVDLLAGDGGAKCGLDDFLVAHGRDALQALLGAAQPRPGPGANRRNTTRLARLAVSAESSSWERMSTGSTTRSPPNSPATRRSTSAAGSWSASRSRCRRLTGRRLRSCRASKPSHRPRSAT